MHDDADLDPRPLDPAEQRAADALRGALERRHPAPGLLAGVQRRAVRRHRRRLVGGAAGGALALAGVLAVVPLDPLSTGTERPAASSPSPVAPDPASSPADPSTETPLLTLEQVQQVAPGASVREAPGPLVITQPYPPPPPVGGYCGDAVLDGVPAATSAWAGAWAQTAETSPDVNTSVAETVLRWDDDTSAAAYAAATQESPMVCAEQGLDPVLATSYQALPQPALGGVPSGPLAVAPVEGTTSGWDVRVVRAQGATAVDLTLAVDAATAAEAGDIAARLAEVAFDQAVGDAPSPLVPPAPPPPALAVGSMLTLDDVAALVPGAEVVESLGPVTAPGPLVGGLCTDEALDAVPLPTSHWTGMWSEDPTAADGAPQALREAVLRWDGAMGQYPYVAAVTASAAACTDPADPPQGTPAYVVQDVDRLDGLPPGAMTDRAPAFVAVAAAGDGRWRVRAVTSAGVSTAVDLAADVRAATAEEAATAVWELTKVAGERATTDQGSTP